jgi:hypothetical protein
LQPSFDQTPVVNCIINRDQHPVAQTKKTLRSTMLIDTPSIAAMNIYLCDDGFFTDSNTEKKIKNKRKSKRTYLDSSSSSDEDSKVTWIELEEELEEEDEEHIFDVSSTMDKGNNTITEPIHF